MGDLTPEQILIQLREVESARDDLLREQAVFDEQIAAVERERDELRAEMGRLGTSPQMIRADIDRLTREFQARVVEYQETIVQGRAIMDETRKALSDFQKAKS